MTYSFYDKGKFIASYDLDNDEQALSILTEIETSIYLAGSKPEAYFTKGEDKNG